MNFEIYFLGIGFAIIVLATLAAVGLRDRSPPETDTPS